jgi:hypothetical protein
MNQRIGLSRLVWALAFLSDVALILAASFLITLGPLLATVLGALLLFILALALAMPFREAIVPSWIERNDYTLAVRWNNWRMEGELVSAELLDKRQLALALKDVKLVLTPVGPLIGLASLALRPALGLFLPGWLAQSYYFSKGALLKSLRTEDGYYQLEFPAFLLGKRKVKKWLG